MSSKKLKLTHIGISENTSPPVASVFYIPEQMMKEERRLMVLNTRGIPLVAQHRRADDAYEEGDDFWDGVGAYAETAPDLIIWYERRRVSEWRTD